MNTLDYILKKFKLDADQRSPLEIPGSRVPDLPALLHDLGMKVGAEIGVERGKYSEALLKLNPGSKLYSIDAWEAYASYREHVNQDKIDGFYAETQQRLRGLRSIIIKGWSLDVAAWFMDMDKPLDYVYIDGNHEFTHVANDIAAWSQVVRPGGIIAGHDFRRSKGKKYTCHVKDVVQAWTYSHGIRPWFIFSEDKAPSWMWVND